MTRIEDAQKRKQDAAAHLIQAQEKLVSAHKKVSAIKNEAKMILQLQTLAGKRIKYDRKKRLQDMCVAILTLERIKFFSELRDGFYQTAFSRVRHYFASSKGFTQKVHVQINDLQLVMLKKIITKYRRMRLVK